MPRETNHSKHPSSARRRRENHLERDAAIKARKRERLYRGEIHKAMIEATRIVEASSKPQLAVGPFRAPDVKVAGLGWQILDGSDEIVSYGSSRDKARKIAKDANEGLSPIVVEHGVNPGNRITHDEAMLRLGWCRVAANKGDGHGFRSIPIDEKFEWVGVQP